MVEFDVDVAACRGRQQRLMAEMQRLGLDLAILSRSEHIYWLTGARFAWTFEPAAALTADGHLTLVAPSKAPHLVAADEVVTYEAKWLSTLRNDQRQASSSALLHALDRRKLAGPIGVEFSSFSTHLTQALRAKLIDIEPGLYRLRRRKDPDELSLLRKAIAGTATMYARAREIIEPDINELEVFNQLQAVAVCEFGEMLTGTGNDYACGARGGPPRNRAIEDGELYILDLGPAFRGYFADNARTICVNHQPTDLQQHAWQAIAEVLSVVQERVKPGVSCRELYEEVQAILNGSGLGKFDHHLGHGIGLFPHEVPHLNPNWDDTFEAGDVFAAEPGLYDPRLRAGIRLENDYLVTATGVELLSDFPLEL